MVNNKSRITNFILTPLQLTNELRLGKGHHKQKLSAGKILCLSATEADTLAHTCTNTRCLATFILNYAMVGL